MSALIAEVRARLAAYQHDPADDRVWQRAAQEFHSHAPTDLSALCDRIEALEHAAADVISAEKAYLGAAIDALRKVVVS